MEEFFGRRGWILNPHRASKLFREWREDAKRSSLARSQGTGWVQGFAFKQFEWNLDGIGDDLVSFLTKGFDPSVRDDPIDLQALHELWNDLGTFSLHADEL